MKKRRTRCRHSQLLDLKVSPVLEVYSRDEAYSSGCEYCLSYLT